MATGLEQLLKTKPAAAEIKRLEDKRLQLLALQYVLIGDQSKKKRFQYFLPGVIDRLRRVYNSQGNSQQITTTHRENFKLAKASLKQLKDKSKSLF